jgi:arylsulfatase A
MNRLLSIAVCTVTVVLLVTEPLSINKAGAQEREETLPNIVLVFYDDFGLGDMKRFNPDSKVPTPNLDRLAESGMVFMDAHTTSSLCAPSRYSVMTGNYPFRGRAEGGVWSPFQPSNVLPEQRTIGNILQDAGYNTSMFGKLNLGGRIRMKDGSLYPYTNKQALKKDWRDLDFSRKIEDGPTDYGFDYSYVLLEGIQAPPYAYFENDKLEGNPADLQWLPASREGSITGEGLRMPDYDSRQAGPRLMGKALDFIDRHVAENRRSGKERPFFMHYASQAVHGPYTPPDTFFGKPVKGVTGVRNRLDMCVEADLAVGELMRKLDEQGLLDNTLFIATSDNGVPWGRNGMQGLYKTEVRAGHGHSQGIIDGVPLRGCKGQIWEGGHRVLFLARWGDGTPAGSRIAPGSSSRQLISLSDLAATFLAITNQSIPEDQFRDSHNLLPILLGKQNESIPVRKFMYQQSGTEDLAGVGNKMFRAVRWNNYKLIFHDGIRPYDERFYYFREYRKFYDLSTDVGEHRNILFEPEHAERIRRMQRMLTEQLENPKEGRTSPVF